MLSRPKILALAAGFASALGFAPLDLWPVTLLALALLLQLVRTAPTLRGALARGYWFGAGHFTLGLNWIAHAFTFQDKMPWWLGYGAVVVLALYLAVYPAVAAGLSWRWGRQDPWRLALVAAAGWIVTEWLRATLFTGFSWNPLGAVLLKPGTAMLAPLIGTYALSGVAMLLGGALLVLGSRLPAVAGADRRASGRSQFVALALVALLLAGPSLVRVVHPTPVDASGSLIRVVQPNIGQREKYDRAFDEINFRRLATLSSKPVPGPRLLLWPEAAIPDFLEEEPWARNRLARLLGSHDMLLTGGVALIGDAEGRVIGARNSLFALGPDARLIGRYDKAHLVPYGEYLPMRPVLSAIGLSRLVPGDLDFWPGPGPQSIAVPGFGKVGVQICYEIIFPGAVVDRRNRPDFLFNPSNDAWFGRWGPPQHLAQARLRAIEEGMTIVRSTPTGISAVIDPDGRLLATVPADRPGFIEMRLPAAHSPTLFARAGNILSLAVAVFLALVAIARGRFAR